MHFLYPLLIPSPGDVLEYYVETGLAGIAKPVYRTLVNSLSGFSLAVSLAFLSIILGYLNKHIESFIEALNTFVQSVSVLVWALVLIMILGVTSPLPPVLVTTAACYPLMLSTLYGGVKSIDKKFSELARLMGATRLQELLYFVLPGVLPYVLSASRSAIGLALRISVVAEAFGASGGVGYSLVYSYDMGIREGVFAWAILLVTLMITLDYVILRPVESVSKKWML